MKCPQCTTQLQENARFCPKCGLAIVPGKATISELPTRQVAQEDIRQAAYPPSSPTGNTQGTGKIILSQAEPPEPLLQYRRNTTKGLRMSSDVANPEQKARSRRSRLPGCALGCLTTLVILLIILASGWLFYGRPYVHNIVYTKLDSALTQAVNNIPAEQIKQLPSNSTIPIQDNTLYNLIALNIAPSDPVQKPNVTINKERVKIEFQVYGYPSAVSFTPTVDNGRLVATNANVEGVIGLVMSPDELTALLNKHFAKTQDKVQRTVTKVELKDRQIGITIG